MVPSSFLLPWTFSLVLLLFAGLRTEPRASQPRQAARAMPRAIPRVFSWPVSVKICWVSIKLSWSFQRINFLFHWFAGFFFLKIRNTVNLCYSFYYFSPSARFCSFVFLLLGCKLKTVGYRSEKCAYQCYHVAPEHRFSWFVFMVGSCYNGRSAASSFWVMYFHFYLRPFLSLSSGHVWIPDSWDYAPGPLTPQHFPGSLVSISFAWVHF